jgi:outer membrane protein
MKQSLSLVVSRSLAVCLLASGAAGLRAAAQTAPAAAAAAPVSAGITKIAVINFEAAVIQSNEGQRNFAELTKKFDPKRNLLKTQSAAIDAEKKELQASADKLSDAERQRRTQDIDTKEKALQRDGEDASNDFQQQQQTTFQQLAEKVFQVLQTYATQNGYTVVLDEAATAQQPPVVLWTSQGTDITRAVILAYNAKSGVPAPPPAAPSAAPSAPTPRSAPR